MKATVSITVTSISNGIIEHEVAVYLSSKDDDPATSGDSSNSIGAITTIELEAIITSILDSSSTMYDISNTIISAGQISSNADISAALTSNGGVHVDAHNGYHPPFSSSSANNVPVTIQDAYHGTTSGQFTVDNLDTSVMNDDQME